MNYILSDNVSLHSWLDFPFAYYVSGQKNACYLNKEQFDLLYSCDGRSFLKPSDTAFSFLAKGLIRPTWNHETIRISDRYFRHDNYYMPQMNLQITAKCNYNCIHCFNATDNDPLSDEFSYDETIRLLDDAEKCGVRALTITGGEPFAHKRFMDIVREIYRRDMFIFDLNTNGYYLNQETLDEFAKIKCRPYMKISFDGIGFHDWIRNRAGAEKDALRAIKLCIDNGLNVLVQYNINKKNLSTLMESIEMLDSIGVSSIRIIRTEPTPRWEQNAGNATLSFREYYDAALDILAKYIVKEHRAKLIFWEIGHFSSYKKGFYLTPVKNTNIQYNPSDVICDGARHMISVGANGQVYPCLQMSGLMESRGVSLGNVKKEGLAHILRNSSYMKIVCQTVKDCYEHSAKCRSCPYFNYCLGGCPALSMLEGESMLDPDPMKCCFFENGYYRKFADLMKDFTNLSEIREN